MLAHLKIGIIILRALTARPHKWQNVNRGLREAPFWNALVLYGHCSNSFRPPSWQALTPPGNVGKKAPQIILASLYTNPPLQAMPIWKQHISKRGFPSLRIYPLFLNTGDVKRLAMMVWSIFLHKFARGCKGLPGWFGTLFIHVCPFDRGGRGGQKLWAMSI